MWQLVDEIVVYYFLVVKQFDIVIGICDEFDVMENCIGGSNEEFVNYLFDYLVDFVVIKYGVEGFYVYSKFGEVFCV